MTDIIDADVKKAFIRKQECFSALTENEITMLADLLIEKHFSAGEIVVIEGQPVDSVYLVISGEADVRHVYIENNTTRFTSLATLGPGEAIGLNDTGFYSISGVRTATVVALSEMVTLCLSIAAFHGFALVNSHVNEVMHQHAKALLGIDK
ncbi:MAG: hypothetical protein ACD_60C00037G0003 [uncultured bacterium]|nr:MAG: hypothetical protein ACD_60C00037G0003 [uncultured bacterium]